MQKVIFRDLQTISYRLAWDLQQNLLKELVDLKMDNRRRASSGLPALSQKHYLLFCEHPHVYTLGKSGSMDHLLLNEEALAAKKIEFFKINRGGDITYHGPGQIVGYPIFDLDEFFTDVHKYVRFIEEAVMLTLAEYNIESFRIKEYTGVWLPEKMGLPKRKICAIGVHLSRWVTMHGFAFNVNSDLSFFKNIIPCGIAEPDKDVTSMQLELGRVVDMHEVKEKLKKHFSNLFGFRYAPDE